MKQSNLEADNPYYSRYMFHMLYIVQFISIIKSMCLLFQTVSNITLERNRIPYCMAPCKQKRILKYY